MAALEFCEDFFNRISSNAARAVLGGSLGSLIQPLAKLIRYTDMSIKQ